MSLTITAAAMERAAYFALPSPVSEAERVSMPARNTVESEDMRTRPMSVSRLSAERAG